MATKVLHILGSLAIGGAENLVLDMIRQGKDNGLEFYVVYMHQSPQERVKQFIDSGVYLEYIKCGKGLKATYNFVVLLRDYIKNKGVHVIHCHNNIDVYWAFFAALGTGCRLILSVHGFNLNFNYLGDKLPILKFLYPDKCIIKKCFLAFVSKRTKDFYCDKYPNISIILNSPVIHNGIDADKILSAEKINICETDKPVFAMVGSFNSPAKRQQIIICKAVGELKEKFNGELPFRFVFIGASNSMWKGEIAEEDINGDSYAACRVYCLKNKLDNDIIFLNPRSDIPGIMRNLKCYVYASLDDTFGLSVIEAVMAAVPVICSDIPTFREVTLNGNLAELVPNNDKAFAKAMLDFVTGNSIISDNVELKRKTALENYSIETCLLNYISLYNTNNNPID